MSRPIEILEEYWGYTQFRPLQAEIIQTVLEGKDCLALLPTGGGKSICFQVPALVHDGLCLVVSPLIALMKDQVRQLQERDIAAEAIYSGMHRREIDRILDNCAYGQVKFLYVSPERLTTELMRERLGKMKLNLIAVDEAHCISQWGYDFRPPYLRIAEIRDLLPTVPIMALTATATPSVVKDIQEKLAFKRERAVWQSSFERKNLSYIVRQAEGKMAKLEDILRKTEGSAVVYVRNRRKTKEIAHWLYKRKIRADFYHAGLDMAVRDAKQKAWIEDKTRVIVSTNAFGMGIDKANVRTVVHMDMPDSLEAYFQEAGRAGRDGERAYAVLLFSPTDQDRLERQHELSFPKLQEIKRVYRALGSYFQLAAGAGQYESYDFELRPFCETYQLDSLSTFHCLKVLQQSGWIVLSDAVFVPASLEIKVNKDELYDFQLRHPKFDKILKAILRSHQGAFSHPVRLKEGQLANFLAMPLTEIRKAMQIMQKEGIVLYLPAKDKPQLTFSRERVDADHLDIDIQAYQFRRKRAKERMDTALQYATRPYCRSQQLLRYFGEKDAPRCGVCDVCKELKREPLSKVDFTKIEAQIKASLKDSEQALKTLVDSFPDDWQERVLEAISYMLEESFLLENAGMLSLAD